MSMTMREKRAARLNSLSEKERRVIEIQRDMAIDATRVEEEYSKWQWDSLALNKGEMSQEEFDERYPNGCPAV